MIIEGYLLNLYYCHRIFHLHYLDRMKAKFKENDPAVIEQLKSLYPGEKDLLDAGFNNSDSMVWFINRQYRIIYFNKAFEDYILNKEGGSVQIGDFFGNYAHLFGKVFKDFWQNYCTKTLDGAYFSTSETVELPNETFYLQINLSTIVWQSRVRGVSFFAFDISDQINLQKQKDQQQLYFRQLIERSSDITTILDEHGHIKYTSPAIKNYIHDDIDELVGLNIFEILGIEDDCDKFKEAFENAKVSPENAVQLKIRAKSPKVGEIWLLVLITNLLDVKPINAVVCTFRVIDSQFILAEEEIDDFPYQSIIDFTSELYLLVDKAGKFSYGSPSIKSYLGYDKEHYLGKSIFDLIHPDCWEYAHGKLEEILTKQKEAVAIHVQLVDRYGMKKWIDGTATNLLNVPGIEAIIGNFRDVGEQLLIDKTEETQIRILQQYFLQHTGPILICEPDFLRIIQINEAALQYFGFDEIELRNKSALDLFPSEYHANLQSLTTSESNASNLHGKIIAHRQISKTSKVLMADVVASVIKTEKCDLVALTIREKLADSRTANHLIHSKINNDISVLKATMEAQENERIEIGKELHDNVAQLISTISLYLGCLREDEVEKYNSEDILDKAGETAQQILKEIRKVSHSLIKTYSEEVGLKLSIEDLLESVEVMNTFTTQLDYINVVDTDLSHDLKINIYRIIQEQINNIIKHAKATHITVRLTQAASILTLQIIDDGVGISKDTDFLHGIGLKNIRNRVQLYNGELIFKTRPNDTGCMLMATFKLHMKQD
jgi:PAS domain S-box-containing protein